MTDGGDQSRYVGLRECEEQPAVLPAFISAPTVREMLAFLDDKWGKGFDFAIGGGHDGFGPVNLAVTDAPSHMQLFHFYDPDGWAQACIEVTK